MLHVPDVTEQRAPRQEPPLSPGDGRQEEALPSTARRRHLPVGRRDRDNGRVQSALGQQGSLPSAPTFGRQTSNPTLNSCSALGSMERSCSSPSALCKASAASAASLRMCPACGPIARLAAYGMPSGPGAECLAQRKAAATSASRIAHLLSSRSTGPCAGTTSAIQRCACAGCTCGSARTSMCPQRVRYRGRVGVDCARSCCDAAQRDGVARLQAREADQKALAARRRTASFAPRCAARTMCSNASRANCTAIITHGKQPRVEVQPRSPKIRHVLQRRRAAGPRPIGASLRRARTP